MTRLVNFQTNFSEGVLGERLQGRADQSFYLGGLKDAKNMLPTLHGAFTRRPGTKFAGSSKSDNESRFIPFDFGQNQSYVLEFTATGSDATASFIRIWTNEGVLLDNIDGSEDFISHIYLASEIESIRYAQSADVLFLTHKNHPPYKFSRYSLTDWRFEILKFSDGPYGAVTSTEHVRLQIKVTTSATNLGIQKVKVGHPFLDVNTKTMDHRFHLPNHGLLEGNIIYFLDKDAAGTTVVLPNYIEAITGSSTGSSGRSTSRAEGTVDADDTLAFTTTKKWFAVDVTSTSFKVADTWKGSGFEIVGATKSDGETAWDSGVFVEFGDFGIQKAIIRKGTVIDAHIVGSDDLTSANPGFIVDSGTTLPAWTVTGPPTYKLGSLVYNDVGDDKIYTCIKTHIATALKRPDLSGGVLYWEKIGINDGGGFRPSDVGRKIRFNNFPKRIISWVHGEIEGVSAVNITNCVSSSDVTTCTTATDHGLFTGSAVTIAGNSEVAHNTTHLITSVPSTTTFLYALDTGDGTGTGGTTAAGQIESSPIAYAQIKIRLESDLPLPPEDDEGTDFYPLVQEYRLGAWDSVNGYPSVVGFFQQRLTFGGSPYYPNTLWFSKTGDFYNYSETEAVGTSSGIITSTGAGVISDSVSADNAITLTVASNTVDLIEWLHVGKVLVIGSSGGVFALFGSRNNATLTPFNFTIQRLTTFATRAGTNAIQIDQKVFFIQDGGKKLRMLDISTMEEDIASLDVTFKADNLAVEGIKEIAYQDRPFGVIWCRMDDGTLLSLTYNPNLEVPTLGWAPHTITGVFGSKAYGQVDSMTVVSHLTRDIPFFLVTRTIAGDPKRYVEYLSKYYDSNETDAKEAVYVDSAVNATSGSATVTWNGLAPHLEGQTVRLFGDASSAGDIVNVPASGNVTSTSAVSYITGGLPYTSYMQTLEPPYGADQRLSLGNSKRIVKLILKIHDAEGIKFGLDLSSLEDVLFSLPEYGSSSGLQTRTEVVTVSSGFNLPYIYIVQDGAFPFTVLAIGLDLETNDF